MARGSPPDRTYEDREAHRRWVERALDAHERALTTYAARILGDVERARDVVQETFLRLWTADREEVDDHLAAWLFTVCRHRALDIVRRHQREQKERHMHPVPDHPTPHSGRSAFEGLAQREDKSRAEGAIERLPERQQELLRLKFQAGLTYRDIAKVTGLSVSNVGYLLHVALKAVRAELGRES